MPCQEEIRVVQFVHVITSNSSSQTALRETHCSPTTHKLTADITTLKHCLVFQKQYSIFLSWHMHRNFSKAGPLEESKWFLTILWELRQQFCLFFFSFFLIVVELMCAIVITPQRSGSWLAYQYVKSCSQLVCQDPCQSYQCIQFLPVPSLLKSFIWILFYFQWRLIFMSHQCSI